MLMHENKTAVVTGAGRGIGRAIALELARCGADVAVIFSASEAQAQSVVGEIREMGRSAEAYKCDVGDFESVKAVLPAVIKKFGQIDILVNNAGITRDSLVPMMSEESFDAVIETNLKGAFNTIRQVYGHMLRRRSGRIINISSVAGMMGNAGQANYASAKAGLIGLTKTLARELAPRGITCNAVAPGYIASDMTAGLPEETLNGARQCIPVGRLGSAEDVAFLVSFLASDQAAYITGEVVKVDGGLYI